MYYHISPTNNIQKFSNEDGSKKMYELCSQWEDETTPHGKLFLGVYDWAFSGSTINFPKLRTGGSVLKNEKISKLLGNEIFGDCFLKISDKDEAKTDALLATL